MLASEVSDMESTRPARVLVICDRLPLAPALLQAMGARADAGTTQFRLVITNPAHAEAHLLHPERHDKAAEAEHVLHRSLPDMEIAVGGPIIGSVSNRHDPMDAVEEVLFSQPMDELIVCVEPHRLGTLTHQDLAHRLRHFRLPITTVEPSGRQAVGL